MNMAKRLPKQGVGVTAVWLDVKGFADKIPAWKSNTSGQLYTWNDFDIIDQRFVLRCWKQEAEVSHEFTDEDKIRAHSWGVAL
jgi:hypothetical protein